MPHVTKHSPKVSTRSVKPYACESSREKRQQDRRSDRRTDRQTHTQTDSETTFPDVLRVVHPKSGLIFEVDFLHDANTFIDRKVIGPKQANTSMSHYSLFQPFFGKIGLLFTCTRMEKAIENMTFGVCPTIGHLSYFGNTKWFYNTKVSFCKYKDCKKKEKKGVTRLCYKRVHESLQKLLRHNAPCIQTFPKSFNSIEQSNPLCPTLGACPAKGIGRLGPKSTALVSPYKRRYPENCIMIG